MIDGYSLTNSNWLTPLPLANHNHLALRANRGDGGSADEDDSATWGAGALEG